MELPLNGSVNKVTPRKYLNESVTTSKNVTLKYGLYPQGEKLFEVSSVHSFTKYMGIFRKIWR